MKPLLPRCCLASGLAFGQATRTSQFVGEADRFAALDAVKRYHLIDEDAPQTARLYHPDSKIPIAAMPEALSGAPRCPGTGSGREPYPRSPKFTTWTLACNRTKWIAVDALPRMGLALAHLPVGF